MRVPYRLRLNELLDRYKQKQISSIKKDRDRVFTYDDLEKDDMLDEQERAMLDEYRYREWSFAKEANANA